MTPIARDVESPRRAGGAIGNVLWSSAIDAFVKTILILVMGNVALISLSLVALAKAEFASIASRRPTAPRLVCGLKPARWGHRALPWLGLGYCFFWKKQLLFWLNSA